jgi:sugar phosphate isomerase/epimerase
VHPRISINQVCFMSESTDQFVDHARALGAEHIVLLSGNLLAEGALEATRRTLGAHGPRVEAIHHRFGVFPDLERDDGTALATLLEVLAAGEALGAQSIYMTTGGRGGLDWEGAARRFAELVEPAVADAAGRGMRLLIETTSPFYVDRHIAHTLADTITLAEHAGIGICAELFYIWTEADLLGQLRRAMPRCGLVQVSDYVLGDHLMPSRAVPGDGAVPLETIVGSMLDAGYTGRFDIELIGPRIDAEGHRAATARAVDRLDSILTAFGA